MITINGRILENRFTTAQWAATTTILKNRVIGYEVAIDGFTIIGAKMGDGIKLWGVLPYMFQSSSPIKIPVSKTGANIDGSGFIDVSASVDNTYDLIGIYQNGSAIYSDIKFDPLTLTVGPFDTATPSGDTILLRFI